LSQYSFFGEHARFDIVVEEVLAGRSPGIVHVIWNDQSGGGEAQVAPGGHQLIALFPAIVRSRSDGRSLRPVLQMPCAPAFILDNSDSQADDIRRVLGAPERATIAGVLSSFWFLAIGAAIAGVGLLWAGLARRKRRRLS
jgi:hypothetical protein